MPRPVTLFTGQWADLPLADLVGKVADFGYDGIELACWGDHLEPTKCDAAYAEAKLDLLGQRGLELYSISNHLVGQAVDLEPLLPPEHATGDRAADHAGVGQLPGCP